tara:strand:- start:6215 stop:7144 length:930 start_codon:yes stop_codon:yes gene_type:complete
MSNKNLLNEAQIRQFMKLAKLAPLTPGFVQGLDESTEESVDEVRTPRPPNDAMENERGRSHGGGNTPINEEDEEAQMHDLEDADADEDHAEDLEMDADEDLGDVEDSGDAVDAGEQMISVQDLMSALEAALEDVTGQPVESSVEGDLADEDEVEADVEMDAEMDLDGDEVDLDVDDEEMLQEEEGSKWKDGEHEYKRRDKDGKVGKRAGDVDGHYKTGETKDLKEEEGSKKGEYRRKDKDGKVGHRAGEGKDGHYKDYEGPAGGNKGDESKTDPGHKDYMKESAATDELVEAITKRVAARILKSALAKK